MRLIKKVGHHPPPPRPKVDISHVRVLPSPGSLPTQRDDSERKE